MSRNAPLAWRHCQASHNLVDSVRRLTLGWRSTARVYRGCLPGWSADPDTWTRPSTAVWSTFSWNARA